MWFRARDVARAWTRIACPVVGIVLVGFLLPRASSAGEPLPADWLTQWEMPPIGDRPLQIVHGIPRKRATLEGMRQYRDLGLGGVVCNVAFADYMRSEAHWQTLVDGVEACRQLGMVVWLYDEEGYPSGAAGGLVLAENRAFEATELAYDPSRSDPFVIRPAYEHTHASNNYFAARRYANLLDDRVGRAFIEKTHEAYRKRLGPYLGSTIEAMFTDEPSLIAVNIGQIPEPVRRRVRVVDPLDPAVVPLPRVPWCYDMAERYGERYQQDLLAGRRSLFVGDTPADRQVRRQFWSLVADLVAQRYFGAIQSWCGKSRVASAGHTLHEESLLHQVALEGNALKVLGRMDIPGLDMLTSNPEAVIHGGWLTAALPGSSAALTGRRRVMTEVSDFTQKMGDAGPVGLDMMQATAAWQAAWGVTDFTLYYGTNDRPSADYQAYCQYVGRLNAVLKPARFDRGVLVYYPIFDLWAEYLPVAERLGLESQSQRARRIIASFMRLGQALQRNQVPFTLVDHEYLAAATLSQEGRLIVAGQPYEALVVPADVELPVEAGRVVDAFRGAGGRVVVDGDPAMPLPVDGLLEQLEPACGIWPRSDFLALGRFHREGRAILLVVNVGKLPYEGGLIPPRQGTWQRMDPATGGVDSVVTDAEGRLPLALGPRQAILWVEAG